MRKSSIQDSVHNIKIQKSHLLCILPYLPYYDTKITFTLTLLHSERPKLYTILAFLSAIGLH